MGSQTYATPEGALYELMARGNKDQFFYSDKPSAIYPFDSSYESQAPSTTEVRRVPPLTACEFGRSVQFEFDLVGDIMRNPTIVINLPTWLPPSVAAMNPRSIVADASGTTYGYTNAIAYFLFESIEFYQDNILLLNYSGDALWAMTMAQGTLAHNRTVAALTGQHDGSRLQIGRNATPPQLRLQLPIIGCQTPDEPGFPQRACLQHSYRLRCKLRRLEDLVEASDGRYKPQPWAARLTQQLVRGGPKTPFTTLDRGAIAPPELFLETSQVYIPREYQDQLQKPQQITFRRPRETLFTQNQTDYQNVVAGGTSLIKRRLEGRHPAERVLWFFRSIADINANRLWKINTGIPGAQSYYNTVGLQIAGRDRELSRNSLVWRDLVNYAKEGIDTQMEIGSMNWGLGAIAPRRFPGHADQVTGAVNFTTADRPTFYIDLAAAPVDPLTGTPNTELRVIVEGWARFDTDGKGRAELFSGN